MSLCLTVSDHTQTLPLSPRIHRWYTRLLRKEIFNKLKMKSNYGIKKQTQLCFRWKANRPKCWIFYVNSVRLTFTFPNLWTWRKRFFDCGELIPFKIATLQFSFWGQITYWARQSSSINILGCNLSGPLKNSASSAKR